MENKSFEERLVEVKNEINRRKLDILCDYVTMNYDEKQIVDMWNVYCHNVENEQELTEMKLFNTLFYETKPLDIIKAVGQHFNPYASYFMMNKDGTFQSVGYIYDIINVRSMCEFMIDYHESLVLDDELNEILNLF